MSNTIEPRSWEEFRSCGLLWWTNRMLHLFGWAIVVEVDDDDGSIRAAYPARTKFRGFGGEAEAEGFVALSEYVAANAGNLLAEAREE